MTGRDLIIHILSNGLENRPVFCEGKFLGFLTVDEVATQFSVSTATVHAWIDRKYIPSINIYGQHYIPANVTVFGKTAIGKE